MAACEECSLLPPSLAGLEDSGMSDIDDKVRCVQAVELGAFSDAEPRSCASSPLDPYISRRRVTGMESILSGSEEDIHLQSINVFFERLKSGGRCNDGQQASNGVLTETVPNESTELTSFTSSPVGTVGPDQGGECVATKAAGSTFKGLKPGRPEAELKEPRGPSHPEEELAETPLNTIGQEQFALSEASGSASRNHPDRKWEKDSNASLTDCSKRESGESSPSASVRRKRTRKRRLELAERQGGSDDEQQAGRGWPGVHMAEENRLFVLKRPQRHARSSESSSLDGLQLNMSAREMKVNGLPDPKGANQNPESLVRQGGLAQDTAEESGIPLNPDVAPVLVHSSRLATPSHAGGLLHTDQKMIHIFCCENEQQQQRSSQADNRYAADAGAGNSGVQCHCTATDQCGPSLSQSPPSLSRAHPPNTSSRHTPASGWSHGFNSPPPQLPMSDENIPVPPAEHPVLLPPPDLEGVSGRSSAASLPTPGLSCLSAASCCALSTESGMSLSNGTSTDRSYSSCLSLSQNDSRCSEENASPTRADEEEGLVPEAHDVAPSPEAGEPGQVPDSTHSVFAMSSFWSEMEKLTINDILGLRQMEQTASQSPPLPPRDRVKPAEFAMTDSGLHGDELDPESSVPVPSEGAPLPACPGADPLVLTGGEGLDSTSGQTSFRRMCKTVSVQNLRALDSDRQKDQALPSLEEEVLRFLNGPVATKEHASPSSSPGGLFQAIFGKRSRPQCSAGSTPPFHTDGHSLPETYDQFMSDWNMEDIFQHTDGATDGPRSAGRAPWFPEAYENLLAPSSSEESAAESDEDSSNAARVLDRLRRTSDASDLSTDIYDHFFTDCDFEQSFFWKSSFSFGNLLPTGSAETHGSCSFGPQSLSGFQVTVNAVDALGKQGYALSALYPAEGHMLPQPPFTGEDLQVDLPSPSESTSEKTVHRSHSLLTPVLAS